MIIIDSRVTRLWLAGTLGDLLKGRLLHELYAQDEKAYMLFICTLLLDLARGCERLHSVNVLHLDVKAANAGFSWGARNVAGPKEACWVGGWLDCGYALAMQPGEDRRPGPAPGTPECMAPEVLEGKFACRVLQTGMCLGAAMHAVTSLGRAVTPC